MHARILAVAVAVQATAWLCPVEARQRISDWTFSPVMGVVGPSLLTINEGIFQSPYQGSSQLTTDFKLDQVGRNQYAEDKFIFRNPLPPVGAAPEVGIELRRSLSPRLDFVSGISFWEVSSHSTINVIFPIQGQALNSATYDRRGKLEVTQFYLGVRQFFWERSHRFNAYLDFNLREMFDVKYQDENVFSFTSGPPKGFKRIDIITARSTGVAALQLGAGLDFRVRERVTVSLEGDYALVLGRDPFLRNVKEKQDFNQGDLIVGRGTPLQGGTENDAYFRTPNGRDFEEARLDLDGWRAAVKVNVEF